MKKENITILKCDVTKKRITIDYHNHIDDLNYSVDKEEPAHPDLGTVMGDLDIDLANALSVKKDAVKNYKVKGFLVDQGDGAATILLDGAMTNAHEYANNVESGKIPFESETLIAKVDKIRDELFQYFFEGKAAQGTLPGMQARGLASNEGENETPD